MADYRIEHDTFGEIRVPADRLWGAQTQRSLENFRISGERMPMELIRALALVKRSCARVNVDLKELPEEKAKAIAAAADEVLSGKHDGEFPLVVWQTGSGTQTNMNMNEVLANRASELLGGERGEKRRVHPNDAVNHGQSSNDVFPTAMSVAAVQAIHDRLIPALSSLRDALSAKSEAFMRIVKIGRTHLQDATPLTLGQEISGWMSQLDHGIAHVRAALTHLCELARGCTARGTGLNAHPEFPSERAAAGRRGRELPQSLRGGHRAAARAHRRAAAEFAHARHRAQSAHRLRQGGADRQESPQGRDHAEAGGARAGVRHSRAVRPVGAAGEDGLRGTDFTGGTCSTSWSTKTGPPARRRRSATRRGRRTWP